MDAPGHSATVLYVDLSSGSARSEPLDPALQKAFLGGWGITNRLAYDLIPPDTDPLAPENAIIIGTGPFTGTIIPGSAELVVTSKFPLNGAFTTGCGGGSFGLMLKTAGYDYVVVSGRAPSPVYLTLAQDGVELHDAADLWGQDSFHTVDELRGRHEPCSVIPIGQAGENLVKISVTAIDKGGTVGSGGLPAVMGAKNLKAIVAVQGERATTVAHRVRLERLVNELMEHIMGYRLRPTLLEGGLRAMFDTAAGAAPIRPTLSDNWSELKLVPGKAIGEVHQRSRKALACASCPLADKEVCRVGEGEGNRMVTYVTHFGLGGDYGAESAEEEFRRSMSFLDAANRYGICRFSFEAVRDLMVYLSQQGMLTAEDTGGVALEDDFATTMRLLEMTALRQGFGDVLAEGIVSAARQVGAEEHAVHIKGFNMLTDPRMTGLGTHEFEYMVNPARCVGIPGSLGSPSYNPGRPLAQWLREAQRIGIPGPAMERIFSPTSFHPGRLTRYTEDWYSLSNCLGRCHRLYINRFFDADLVAALYSAVSGIETSPSELLKAAERAWNVSKLLNARVGFDRKDDRPPQAWFVPLKGEGAEYPLVDYYRTTVLSAADIEHLLDDYYEERGWDRESGTPSPRTIRELGL